MVGLFIAALPACSSVPLDTPSKDKNYKRDMRISVDGKNWSEGALVVTLRDKFDLQFESKGKLDLFTFTSCHREFTKESAWDSGIFPNKKRASYTYAPVPGIETDKRCVVDLGGYDINGRHSWGMIAFEDGKGLPAEIGCNGYQYHSYGTTICQSHEGLEQTISFQEKVLFAPDENCNTNPTPVDTTLKNYKYAIPKGRCATLFRGIESGKQHYLITLGYEQILIRGD